MKPLFFTFAVILLVTVLGLSGCSGRLIQPSLAPTQLPPAPEPTTEPPSSESPSTTVAEMVDRANAGDYAGAAELFADDALLYFVGMPPTGMEVYWGKEQFRTFMEECCTGQNFVWEVTPERVHGGAVYAEARTWMDFTRELGVAPNTFHEVFVVKDGKITLYHSTMTEEALVNFKPVLFEAIPELAAFVQPPADLSEPPVNEITVTITNSTCAYDGPMTLQAGELTVTVDVQDERFEKYAVTAFTLEEGKDLLDLMASTYNSGPSSWSDMVFFKELQPGENRTYEGVSVNEGLLYMVCWASPPDMPIGNAGPFVVTE